MLDAAHGRDQSGNFGHEKSRKKNRVRTPKKSAPVVESLQRTQWTVKGIDKETLELSRKEARKRGMKFGAWVNQVLRTAASQDDASLVGTGPQDLLTKMADLEFKLGELKDSSSNIQHDVRILQTLVSRSA